ncbi:hypothetical protein C8F01DRAFT_359278 [Mycena amicta]|nr:hypothetical protein C8F01DRAFT_359278 [Mycena amicta]
MPANFSLATPRSLPTELWTEIFSLCVGADRELPIYATNDPRYAPVVLTHICSLWRHIALDTPRLWIHLTFFTPVGPKFVTALPKLVKRSNKRSLVVRIRRRSSLSTPPYDATQSTLPLVLRARGCRARIQSLHIYATSTEWIGAARLTFPQLQSLHIDIGHLAFSDGHIGLMLRVFSNSPSLRSLEIADTWLFLDDMRLMHIFDTRFPWKQLASLRISAMTDRESITAMLSRCPGLEEFEVSEFDGEEPLTPGAGGIVTLPNLKTLKFRTAYDAKDEDREGFQYFSSHVMPSLQHLSFSMDGCRAQDLRRGFPLHSGCTLTTLEISSIHDASTGILIPFLRHHGTIEHLRLTELVSPDVILALIHQDTPLLPSLRTLHVKGVFPSHTLVQGLCRPTVIPEFLVSRDHPSFTSGASVARLEWVELLYTPPGLIPSITLKKLAPFTRSGRLRLLEFQE